MAAFKDKLVTLALIGFLSNSMPLWASDQRPDKSALADEYPRPGPVNFTQPPSSADEAVDQLRNMISRDYVYWTGSVDKPLTITQIGKLQRNSAVTGGQAVLMGVLALTIDHAHGFIDRLSFDCIMALAGGGTISVPTSPVLAKNSPDLDEPPTFTFRNVVINYRKLFDNLVSNTTAAGFKLWGRKTGPILDGLQQGPVGNCYWIAAVEAVAQKRPEIIVQTIRQIGQDQYQLNFRGEKRPIVVTLTHGAMAQLNLDPHDGCWLTILALGEAAIRGASGDIVNFWRETPLGVVAHSGSEEQVLESLTGEDYDSIHLRRTPRTAVSALLATAMNEAMPTVVSTGDHCLSICDYNPQTEMLTILNPWGTSDDYTIEGTDITVKMNGGYFKISLSDFCRSFRTLSIPAAATKLTG